MYLNNVMSPMDIFSQNNQDPTFNDDELYFSSFLRLTSWDFGSICWDLGDLFIYIFLETEGQQANTEAHEAIDHLASFPSGRHEISQSGSNHQPLP